MNSLGRQFILFVAIMMAVSILSLKNLVLFVGVTIAAYAVLTYMIYRLKYYKEHDKDVEFDLLVKFYGMYKSVVILVPFGVLLMQYLKTGFEDGLAFDVIRMFIK